ncbi:hypothetical protein MRB53_032210 [Persea americana]|uniref:Uncharacterized protein n=1 Tax=Persea americana TaxID=3435 RepID=A0ACC2KRL6_PERAE|nr:hypothetical protein MRB53_032210 [Persea americana]
MRILMMLHRRTATKQGDFFYGYAAISIQTSVEEDCAHARFHEPWRLEYKLDELKMDFQKECGGDEMNSGEN